MATSMHQLSDSKYASRRKELLALMSQLRAVGAQEELNLPRIAVIGNQSAGKSSVVEAISGIKVPRDSGTCTRCPMECRLASAPQWSCRISIRHEFDASGKRLPKISEQEFGGVISDKDTVEIMLRRAQLAVLDPKAAMSDVMKMGVEELKEKMQDGKTPSFSKNIVCVDLEGPDLTDLQFVDLPGIIQNATAEAVRLVEEMVVEHIKGNCLILVAIPMTDDIENQKAMTLAREQDPDGTRTIGVLTKPDLLSAGSTKSRALWLDVIEGRRHKLFHGYYCTRQPDDEERAKGISSQEARKAEVAFFARSAPWATSTQQERFGTENLIATLSRLLVNIIGEKLPTIIETANAHLEDCRAALSRLPPPSTEEPATHLLMLITEFCTEIKQYVRGSLDPSELIQKNNAAFGEFKRAIRRTAPGFVALLPVEGNSTAPDQIINDDEDGDLPADNDSYAAQQPIYLTDVRETLRRAKARELPGDVPPAAKASLIADFQQSWSASTDTCFETVRDALMHLLMQSMEHLFSRYSALKHALRTCLFYLIQIHYTECARYLAAVLEMETTPMTQNDHYLLATTEKWVGKYKEQRAGKSSVPDVPPTKRQKIDKANPADAPSNMFSFGAPSNRSNTPGPAPMVAVPAAGTGFGNGSTTAPASPAAPAFGTQAFASASAFGKPTPLAPSGTPVHPFAAFSTPVPAFGTGVSTPATPIAPGAPSAVSDPTKMREALALLVELGYSGVKEEDLGKLRAGDEYETEILLMSGVRAYFQVSYKRIIDNVPGLIDTKFVKTLANGLQSNLVREFKLGQPDAHVRCAEYLTEDAAVVAKRADLSQRMKMLQGVQQDLMNFGN
ncbi:P-loop containing nucleoside triphosphate hydrolase protein [Mycena crocata]|nr:P-loop containing nucleoside triphosphate hydrolase protein [Mycena crocata]